MSLRHAPRTSAFGHHTELTELTELEERRRLERALLLPLLSLFCIGCALLIIRSPLTSTLQREATRAHQWLFDAARHLPHISAHLTPQERSRDGLIRSEVIWEPSPQRPRVYTSHTYIPHPLKTVTLHEQSAQTSKGRTLSASTTGDQAWYEAYASRLPQWSAQGALWAVREPSRAELKRLNAPLSARLMSNAQRPARLVTRVASPTPSLTLVAPLWTELIVMCVGFLIGWLLREREPTPPWRAALSQTFWVSVWLTSWYLIAPLINLWEVNEALRSLAQRLQLAPLDLFERLEGLWGTLTLRWISCVLLMWLGLWVGVWASPPHLKRQAHI